MLCWNVGGEQGGGFVGRPEVPLAGSVRIRASLGLGVIRKLNFISTPLWRCCVQSPFRGSLSRECFFLLGWDTETELLEMLIQSAPSPSPPVFNLTSEKSWTMQNYRAWTHEKHF